MKDLWRIKILFKWYYKAIYASKLIKQLRKLLIACASSEPFFLFCMVCTKVHIFIQALVFIVSLYNKGIKASRPDLFQIERCIFLAAECSDLNTIQCFRLSR